MASHRIFAAQYDRITAKAERAGLAAQRQALLSGLTGDVVEIGAGTGVNLPHYGAGVTSLLCVEPDVAMRRRLIARLSAAPPLFPVSIDHSALGETGLPLDDESVDALVSTLVLCSVHNVAAALDEIRRVIRPGGRLMLIEHVRGHGATAVLQAALTPLQRVVAAGCHLNRDTRSALVAAGFDVSAVAAWSLPGSVPLLRQAISGWAVAPRS